MRRRWLGLIWLGVLAGVIGGLATAAIAGERRTDSAAPRLLEATLAPDAFVMVREYEPGQTEQTLAALEGHPDVTAIWPLAQYIGRTAGSKDWYYPFAGDARSADIYRPLVVEGRLPRPDSLDEVVISLGTAANTGLEVGSSFVMDFYTGAQMANIMEDTEMPPEGAHVELHVVGLLRDGFDLAIGSSERFMLASPAFGDGLGGAVEAFRGFGVRVAGGATPEFVQSLQSQLAPGSLQVNSTVDSLRNLEPANRVMRLGTWILAAVVAAIGSFALAQAIRRHIGRDLREEATLRTIGFTRRDGVVAAMAPGTIAAAVALVVLAPVAAALSTLFPLGRARLFEPHPGIEVNVAVIALGALATVTVLLGLFAAMAWLDLRRTPQAVRREPSRLTQFLLTSAPLPVSMGVHLALETPGRRSGVSARAAIVGTALGIAGLVATTTFSHSLEHLVTTPAEYGVDFDLAIEVPASQVEERLAELAADPELEAVAEQRAAAVVVDGVQANGVMIEPTRGSIRPRVVDGRLPEGLDELAVGPGLAARHGMAVGDVVRVGEGPASRSMRIVGTVLDPEVTSADYGAAAFLRADALAAVALDEPYPVLIVRYAPGVDRAGKTAELDERYPYGVMDESHPAVPGELRSLQDIAGVPTALQWFFAGLTVVALANGIVAVGRRSRHVLGVVRGLGFTSTQIRATVVSMAAAMATVATVLGMPLGLLLGTIAWSQVSTRAYILPSVRWPLLVCLAALPVVAAVAAGVALWPAHRANAGRPAEILRTE